ncbi:MAG: hypothetical protein KMY54_00925 [Erysipelothrix sp.]|nr:hypothetical protein [Erysipelothrix sp.]
MEKFEYKGKRYIKIKQDWYSEIGEKQPLKLAVELDSEFSRSLLEKEESIKNLLDQSAYFVNTGIIQKAFDFAQEALRMAVLQKDVNALPQVIVKNVDIYRELKRFSEGVDLIFEMRSKYPELTTNPHVETALAALYCDLKQGEAALESADLATEYFRMAKKKLSDECLIVWNRIKSDFAPLYQQYRLSKTKGPSES